MKACNLPRVKKRKIDDDGIPVGVANDNPLLDNRVYVVEWLDGHTEELMANVIAENLFAQVDDEGNRFVLLDDIVDHRKSADALSGDDGFIVTRERYEASSSYYPRMGIVCSMEGSIHDVGYLERYEKCIIH